MTGEARGEKARILMGLYVEALKERGWRPGEDEIDSDLANDAEYAAIARFRQVYAWRLGDIDDETWERFQELRSQEGI